MGSSSKPSVASSGMGAWGCQVKDKQMNSQPGEGKHRSWQAFSSWWQPLRAFPDPETFLTQSAKSSGGCGFYPAGPGWSQTILPTVWGDMLPPHTYLPQGSSQTHVWRRMVGSTLSVSADKCAVASKFQVLPWAPRGSALGSSHGGRKA